VIIPDKKYYFLSSSKCMEQINIKRKSRDTVFKSETNTRTNDQPLPGIVLLVERKHYIVGWIDSGNYSLRQHSTVSDGLLSTLSADFYCRNTGGSTLIPTAEATPR